MIAFDPGVCTGWATGYRETGLYSCGVFEWPHLLATPVWLREAWMQHGLQDLLVIERPQVYSARLQKGDQADIVATAIRAGVIRGTLPNVTEVRMPTPQEWKKSIDKDVHNKRVLAALSFEERARIPKLPKTKLHNCIDAVGLVLKALGRI